MNEEEAWQLLAHYAHQAKIGINRSMAVGELRRALAKAYQPRLANDDDSIMRQVNPAIDVIDAERDRRELLGIPEPDGKTDATQPGWHEEAPWQPDPQGPTWAPVDDYADIGFIQRQIYERASKFGNVELVKAWAWDGHRFRKVISAYANQYAYDDLARSLLRWLLRAEVDYTCEAVFLTEGAGRAQSFQLILVKVGRGYENVMSYDQRLDIQPDDPSLPAFLSQWLRLFRHRLEDDQFN